MNKTCILCGKQAILNLPRGNDLYFCECPECGRFGYNDYVLGGLSDEEKFKISCVLVERKLMGHSGTVITQDGNNGVNNQKWSTFSISEIVDYFPQSASDIFNRSLVNLSRMLTKPGGIIDVNDWIHRPVFSPGRDDVNYLFVQLVHAGYITQYSGFGNSIQLTLKGWQEIGKIKIGTESLRKEKRSVFVAMWFSGEVENIWLNGLKLGIENSGRFEAVRIDKSEHNNKICDEIIAKIRESVFLVADFSGHRGGVYFEAGFAHGLGKPVIWCVRTADLKDLHFDTRQYNHIVYDNADDLMIKLSARIAATIV